jgi:GntR family transcriptional regulator
MLPGQRSSKVQRVADIEPFDKTGPGYVWLMLADHLAARIAAGEWAPGERLPGEPALAAAYDVGGGTVRRALTELRARGLVETYPQKGTYVVKG